MYNSGAARPIDFSFFDKSEFRGKCFLKQEDRGELIRLGVAAACAVSIFTFSLATYLEEVGVYQSLFFWLSFALYLPVLTYVAWPINVGAWNSLRQKKIAIDLPIAITSLSGFVFSTVELLDGKEDIYFDSLSGFLFLVLLSRLVERRLQRRLLRPQELLESLHLSRVRKVHESGWTWTAIEQVMPGDRLLLCAPETLPAEAELVSNSAHFSMAWLSGESKPQAILRGAVVSAGARLASGEAQLIAKKPLSETSFGQTLQEMQDFSLSKAQVVSLVNRWTQCLLGIVFLAALVFLLTYWPTSSVEALRRALALMIIACPCAMSFAAPLALVAALKRAQRNGLLVRSASVFENATGIGTIFFNKTVTLTATELLLREDPWSIPQVYQKIILTLENESMHPIAFALRKTFATPSVLPPVDGFREIAGHGVSGFIYGKFYEIKRSSKSEANIGCTLFEDQHPILSMSFAPQVKPDCAEVLNKLRRLGFRLILLSADKTEAVYNMANQLGFQSSDVYAEVDSNQKAFIVSQTANSMMVGDGVNDSLALIRAKIGVAVSGGMEPALRSSDVYLVNSSLKGIGALLHLSQESLDLIFRNLWISVLYYLIGGTLALMGFVNPLVATLLMPISTGFILLTTWFNAQRP